MQQELKAIMKQHDLNNQTKIKIYTICIDIYNKLKVKGYVPSRSFFTSYANKFIEQLIHIHSQIINKLLKLLVKQHAFMIIEKQTCQNIGVLIENINQQQWKNITKQNVINKLCKIINYFLSNESYNKTKAQRQNIYLEIQCSLNYTCPICLSNKSNNQIKSSTLLEEQKSLKVIVQIQNVYTTKEISSQQKQKLKSLPNNGFQKAFQKMNQKRRSLKLIEDNRKVLSNKQWLLFGKLLDLDRQQFVYNTIYLPKIGCPKDLQQNLNQRNAQNKNLINKFRKKRHHFKDIRSRSNIQNINSLNFSSSSQQNNAKIMQNIRKNIRLSTPKKSTIKNDAPKYQSTQQIKNIRQKIHSLQQKSIQNKSMNRVKIKCIDFSDKCIQSVKANNWMNKTHIKNVRMQVYKNFIMHSDKII